MKKLIYLFSIAFIILQSCSTKDSNSSMNTDNSLLLRKWYRVSNTRQGRIYYNQPCSNGNRDYVQFSTSDIYNTFNITSTNNCNYFVEGPFKWIRNGDVITFSFNGVKTSTAIISELTATSLKFVETEEGSSVSALYIFSSY